MPIPPEQLQLLKDNIVGILGLLAQSASAKPTVDILVSKINDFVDENTSSSSRSERCSCLLQVCTYLQNELGPQIDSELWTRLLLEEPPNPVPAPAQQLPQSAIPFSAEALYSYVLAMNAILGFGARSPRFAGVPPLVAPHHLGRTTSPEKLSLLLAPLMIHHYLSVPGQWGMTIALWLPWPTRANDNSQLRLRLQSPVIISCMVWFGVLIQDIGQLLGLLAITSTLFVAVPHPTKRNTDWSGTTMGLGIYTQQGAVVCTIPGWATPDAPETSGLVALSASVQNWIDTLLSENDSEAIQNSRRHHRHDKAASN